VTIAPLGEGWVRFYLPATAPLPLRRTVRGMSTSHNTMFKKFAAGACAVVVASLGAGPAFGGEITGKGKPTGAPLHANSVCVFSGRNDDPTAPLSLDLAIAPNGPGGVSQSFGQDVKIGLDPRAFNPGDACRGGSN
jgi:hypothetical protein